MARNPPAPGSPEVRGRRGYTSTVTESTKIGLYYPHIHFRNEEWLRTSLLYWDRIARIVPWGYPPKDSPTVKRLTDEFDFIDNMNPDYGILDSVGRPFIQLIRGRGDELQSRYQLTRTPRGPITVEGIPVHAEILAPKLSAELMDALRESALTTDRADRSGLASFYLHPELANVYMTALAQAMASAAKCQLVSDVARDHVAASGLTVDRLGELLLDLDRRPLGRGEVETHMALLALRIALPKGLKDVPLDKLFAFRERHREELTAYQGFLAGLVGADGPLADLGEIHDAAILQSHLKAYYAKRFAPELRRLRRSFGWLGVDFANSVMSIRLPEGLAFGASVGAAILQPVFASAALGLAVLKVARAARTEARKSVADAPTAFLMYAGEELSPRNMVDRLMLRGRHAVLGA